LCQAKLSDAAGLTPGKERNEVWREKMPRKAGSDYIRQAKHVKIQKQEQ